MTSWLLATVESLSLAIWINKTVIPDYRPCYIHITCSWVCIWTIISRFVYLIGCVSILSLALNYAADWILDLRIQFLS